MSRCKTTPEQIDAILPQTQCGLCGYGACMPYAKALIDENAAINLCPPGGVEGLESIGKLLNEDPAPFMEDMAAKAKPQQVAVIREDECIGCAKCIKACPVDAILGTGKMMHTVIAVECTGCELCVAPCPVDCIDIISIEMSSSTEIRLKKNQHLRQRFNSRNNRLNITKSYKKLEDKNNFLKETLERKKLKNP